MIARRTTLSAEPGRSAAGMNTWTIDSAHSGASFSLKHMMVATVRGHLGGLAGAIDFDPAAPERSSVEVPKTYPNRQHHLQNPWPLYY